jgi:hypothetical protein
MINSLHVCTIVQPALERLAAMVEYFNETLSTRAHQIEHESQSSGEHSCKSADDPKGM